MFAGVWDFILDTTLVRQEHNKNIDIYRTFFSRNAEKCPFFLIAFIGFYIRIRILYFMTSILLIL